MRWAPDREPGPILRVILSAIGVVLVLGFLAGLLLVDVVQAVRCRLRRTG